MNTKFIGIIIGVIVIVAVAIVAYVYLTGWDEYWKTETEFGEWGQDIVLEYEDGSTMSVYKLMQSRDLTVIHEGKVVTGIQYRLDERATGTGYNTIKFRFPNYKLIAEVMQGGTVYHTFEFSIMSNYQPERVIDGEWHNIFGDYRGVGTLVPDFLNSGTYTLKYSNTGSIQYSADGGTWNTVASPPSLSITVTVEDDKSLTVVLSRGANVSYD